MKSFLLLLATLFFTLSAQASNDCRLYHIMSRFDAGSELSKKIIEKSFVEKGYEIIPVERIPMGQLEEGSINELIIFSDVHPSFGARTDIALTNISLNRMTGNLTIEEVVRLKLSKSDSFFNTGVNRLVKAVSEVIPPCETN